MGLQFFILCGFLVTVLFSALLNGWLGGGVIQVQQFVLTAFLPFILYVAHSVSAAKQKFMLFVLLVSSLVMIDNGMSQKESIDGIGWAGSRLSQGTRITFLGILEDPNDLGGYFVMCLPFAAYFFWHGFILPVRLFGLFMLAALAYGIYLTDSRGTLLAAMGLSAAFIYYRFGFNRAFVLGLISLPIVGFVFSRFRALELDSSAGERIDLWYEGMQMWEQNPIFGVGMNNFNNYTFLTAHNSFVLVISELGLIGYMLWLGFLLVSAVLSLWLLVHYRKLLMANDFRKLDPGELNESLALNSAIFFSLLAFLISAFFLSRSYVIFPFMLCAFATASYTRITRMAPELKI